MLVEKTPTESVKLKDAISLNSIYFSGYKTAEKKEYLFEIGPFITMLFAESGSFTVKYQGNKISVLENNLVFVPPNETCLFESITAKARVFVCSFSLQSKIPLDLFDQTFFIGGLKQPILKRLARSSVKVFPNGDVTSKNETADELDEHLVKNCIELLVIECVNPTNKSIIDSNYPVFGKGEGAKIAMQIYEYLAKNTHKNVTLEEIADELFFSVSYVKTVFKKHTGKPIVKAFNELKVKKAKLLIKKGLHFSEIAESLGFSSQQYFSKTFKSVTGITPIEYKKTLIK